MLLFKATYQYSFTYSNIDGGVNPFRATASSSGAIRVRFFAQGNLDTLVTLPANPLYLLSLYLFSRCWCSKRLKRLAEKICRAVGYPTAF